MTYNLQLKKFDMKTIPDDSVVLLIGKRNTGKSFLAKNFMYYHKDIPVGCVISGTESANKFYSKMIPHIFIHEEYNPIIIENFVKRQKKITKLKKKEELDLGVGKSNIDNRAFLIFDDLMDEAPRWTKDPNVRKIYISGRHIGILHICVLQYCISIPTTMRFNSDFIFILRENIIANRKRLYDNFAGVFPTFEMFCSVMDSCTENYECLVINNLTKSNRIEDQVFWYKADSHEDFKMGPPEVWKYCEEKYNNESSDDDTTMDINKYQKKKGSKLQVKKV